MSQDYNNMFCSCRCRGVSGMAFGILHLCLLPSPGHAVLCAPKVLSDGTSYSAGPFPGFHSSFRFLFTDPKALAVLLHQRPGRDGKDLGAHEPR